MTLGRNLQQDVGLNGRFDGLDFFTNENLKFLTRRMGYFSWKNLHLSKVPEGCSRRMFSEITARTPLILDILYCVG